MKTAVRKIVKIDNVRVTLRIEYDLEFDGITLEHVGEPKVTAFVAGAVVDPYARFGDDRMRKLVARLSDAH